MNPAMAQALQKRMAPTTSRPDGPSNAIAKIRSEAAAKKKAPNSGRDVGSLKKVANNTLQAMRQV